MDTLGARDSFCRPVDTQTLPINAQCTLLSTIHYRYRIDMQLCTGWAALHIRGLYEQHSVCLQRDSLQRLRLLLQRHHARPRAHDHRQHHHDLLLRHAGGVIIYYTIVCCILLYYCVVLYCIHTTLQRNKNESEVWQAEICGPQETACMTVDIIDV